MAGNREDFNIDSLERILGRVLTEEELGEVDLFNKGRHLQQIRPFPGYQVILEILQSYVTSALKELAKIPPGDPKVDSAHRIAYTAGEIYGNFLVDVQNAIEAANTPPAVLLQQLKHHTSAPPDL